MSELIPAQREALIDEYNVLNERKWDLLDQIEEVDLARIALIKQLRGEE